MPTAAPHLARARAGRAAAESSGCRTTRRPHTPRSADANALRDCDLHRPPRRRTTCLALARCRPCLGPVDGPRVEDGCRYRPRCRSLAGAPRGPVGLQEQRPVGEAKRLRLRGPLPAAPDSRSNVSRRLRRAVDRANVTSPPKIYLRSLPSCRHTRYAGRSPRSSTAAARRPVYVMQQMGHSDPKLALRIYTKTMGDVRRRGPGARLTSVIDGASWASLEAQTAATAARDIGLRAPLA